MSNQKVLIKQHSDHYTLKFKSGPLRNQTLNFPLTRSDPSSEVLKHLIYTFHEAHSYFQRPDFYRSSPLIIDCGAYPGEFTLLASRLIGKKGTVLSMEPSPDNHTYITRVINSNPHPPNIFQLKKAVSHYIGKATITDQRALSTLGDGNDTTLVTTIDALVTQFRKKNQDILIKMDIEGAELDALFGTTSTIKSFKPDMMIAAYHKVHGVGQRLQIEKFLKKHGYKFVKTLYPDHPVTYASMKIPSPIP